MSTIIRHLASSLWWSIVVGWLFCLSIAALPVQTSLELDVATATTWSSALESKLQDLELNALQVDKVVSMVNGFVMDSPERLDADRKWVDMLSYQISSLMGSRFNSAKALAQQVEQLYGRGPSSTGLCITHYYIFT
jgi:hypothetical protein